MCTLCFRGTLLEIFVYLSDALFTKNVFFPVHVFYGAIFKAKFAFTFKMHNLTSSATCNERYSLSFRTRQIISFKASKIDSWESIFLNGKLKSTIIHSYTFTLFFLIFIHQNGTEIILRYKFTWLIKYVHNRIHKYNLYKSLVLCHDFIFISLLICFCKKYI